MNANELADKIEDARNETDFQRWASQAPDMLRQQRAEIEALEKLVSEIKYEKSSGVYEMRNEPVGTVIETEEIYGHTFKKRKSKRVQWLKKVDVGTLLYVNQSKEDEGKVCARCGAIAYDPVIKQTSKELTDEEIKDFIATFPIIFTPNDLVVFARAILRKAQEK